MHPRPLVTRLLLTLVLFAGVAPGLSAQDATPATDPDDATATFRGGATRSGAMSATAPDGPPSFLWRVPIDGITGASPAVGEGMVIVSNQTKLVALDQATGAERWRAARPQSGSSPLIAGGLVYVGTRGEGLKAYDAETGAVVWQFLSGIPAAPDGEPAGVFDTSPILVDGTLFMAGGSYGGLFALDPATGEERWRFDTHGWVRSSPAVAGGIVYIASNALFDADQTDPAPSALYAVDAATGAERWSLPFAADIEMSWSTPLIHGATVLIGVCNFDGGNGVWIAADAATGTERWRFETSAPMWWASPASDGATYFLPDGELSRMSAVDAATGEPRWEIETEEKYYVGPTLAGDTLYIHDESGALVALDGATGDQEWTLDIGPAGGGGGVGAEPAIVDGIVYATGGGLAYALTDAGSVDDLVLAGQPSPPTTGPGSEETAFPATQATKYGPDPGGYWIWEPTAAVGDTAPAPGPFPVVLYLSGCCGAGDYPTPEEVDPWLTHLARQGYVVIAPVYNMAAALEDSKARLREALTELEAPGHAAIDLDRFAVVAYSFGGVPAVEYAASAVDEGIPTPDALFLNAPCANRFFCPGPPEEVLPMPVGMKAVVLAYRDDEVVGVDQPRQIYHAMTGLPTADRDFVLMKTDPYGQPLLIANHQTAFQNVDALDWYGVWKLSDALLSCAFAGEDCEYALGDTPEQRFMGTWDDGAPVTELEVSDDPGLPPAERDEPSADATATS